MLGVVWQELILPKLPLPSKLTSKLRGAVSWPAPSPSAKHKGEKVLVKQPKESPSALDILLINAPRLVENLKSLAQRNVDPKSKTKKAATLHAILHSIVLAALYAAINSSPGNEKLVLGSGTPISLREETPSKREDLPLDPLVNPSSPTLPVISGNFVSNFNTHTTISPQTTFWSTTNHFASTLASPKTRKRAKAHMGMLAYIPDFDHSSPSPSSSSSPTNSHSEKGGCVNGWEQFFHQKATSSTPFDAAFYISNLGFLPLSPLTPAGWETKKISWAQSHTAQGSAFGVEVLGFSNDKGGEQTLSLGISSRKDAFADKDLYQRFVEYLRRLVLLFASQTEGVGKGSHDTETETKMGLGGGGRGVDWMRDPTFGALARVLAQSDA